VAYFLKAVPFETIFILMAAKDFTRNTVWFMRGKDLHVCAVKPPSGASKSRGEAAVFVLNARNFLSLKHGSIPLLRTLFGHK
jgi:hypothetical protein